MSRLGAVARRPARHLPGEEGIWLFIGGDMLVFTLFFATYLYYRGQDVALFRASQAHLSAFHGLLNTVFMLSSSWFVALAVQAARRNLGKTAPALFIVALSCGAAFCLNKVFEYAEKLRQGFTLNSNDFFIYYYTFTGIHLLHVLIGMGVLAFAIQQSWRGDLDAGQLRNLESSASFWHMVDLLWIVLFALLYLIH